MGSLPQAAWRLDNDFSRLFAGETLVSVETLNIDAASFAQIEKEAGDDAGIARTILQTVAERGKQHNPVTGSGGMLLGQVEQGVEGREGPVPGVGTRIASLVSLTLTPLRIDRVLGVRRSSAQVDVEGEAVLFASAPFAEVPPGAPERLIVAALDVAGAAPQVARLVMAGQVIVVLGAGGKSGILCVAEARRTAGPAACVVGIEQNPAAASDLASLGFCDVVRVADARNAIEVRDVVLGATGGREADVTISCVNAPDVEMAAILVTRHRGKVYFFAMSTSFTKAALGAEGVGKDVDLYIGNGYARGHAAHTLALLDASPAVRALFLARYG